MFLTASLFNLRSFTPPAAATSRHCRQDSTSTLHGNSRAHDVRDAPGAGSLGPDRLLMCRELIVPCPRTLQVQLKSVNINTP